MVLRKRKDEVAPEAKRLSASDRVKSARKELEGLHECHNFLKTKETPTMNGRFSTRIAPPYTR